MPSQRLCETGKSYATAAGYVALAAAAIAMAGCGKSPLRPQSALRSPSGYNNGQTSLLDAPGPHPLLVVTLPNNRNGKPHVDTVLSVLAPHSTAGTAPPPPPVPPSTVMQVHEDAVPATQPAAPAAH